MADIITIKDYLKKLQKVINFDAEFKFGGIYLVKKTRIDDITCCIIASLPDSYKKVLKSKNDIQKYSSVLSYGLLTKLLSKKFFLDKNLCMVKIDEINKLIGAILLTIEKDIHSIEQLFNQ